jgi:hypothetical protein
MTDVYERKFPARLDEMTEPDADGRRHLIGRLVPYDLDTRVTDKLPDGGFDDYREGFRRSAFERQLQPEMARRVGFRYSHQDRLLLGNFCRLWHGPDGLYGDVAIHRSRTTDVEDFLHDGINELSVEFRLPAKGEHTLHDRGTRWRVSAHLEGVALEAKGAYPTAEVLQFRAAKDETEAEAEERANQERLEQARKAEEDAAAERRKLEVEQDAERRARLQRYVGENAVRQAKQDEMLRKYGVTVPGHPFGR